MATLTHTRRELERTWRTFRSSQAPRVLNDAWPQVLPQPGGALVPGDAQRRTSSEGSPSDNTSNAWLTALAAFDELQSYRDLDTLLRRAVELLREALKLERAAVFLLESNTKLCGTFGTGLCGETTDERHIAFEMGTSHREAFALTSQGLAQWSRFPNVPLFAQQSNQTVVLRTGENVIVPIPSAGRCIGLIACDKGYSGACLDIETLIRTAVFARILGPALNRWPTFEAPNEGESGHHTLEAMSNVHSELVGSAIRRLRLDPNEPRDKLAKSLGTTADRLGRLFKAEMGETLPEYRNKLRLQRFFSLVDPNGGDLLTSALSAGFGSYAQFNRVFHQCYGTAPATYLKHRSAGSV